MLKSLCEAEPGAGVASSRCWPCHTAGHCWHADHRLQRAGGRGVRAIRVATAADGAETSRGHVARDRAVTTLRGVLLGQPARRDPVVNDPPGATPPRAAVVHPPPAGGAAPPPASGLSTTLGHTGSETFVKLIETRAETRASSATIARTVGRRNGSAGPTTAEQRSTNALPNSSRPRPRRALMLRT